MLLMMIWPPVKFAGGRSATASCPICSAGVLAGLEPGVGNTQLYLTAVLLIFRALICFLSESVVPPPPQVEMVEGKNWVDVLVLNSAKQACQLALVLGYS